MCCDAGCRGSSLPYMADVFLCSRNSNVAAVQGGLERSSEAFLFLQMTSP